MKLLRKRRPVAPPQTIVVPLKAVDVSISPEQKAMLSDALKSAPPCSNAGERHVTGDAHAGIADNSRPDLPISLLDGL